MQPGARFTTLDGAEDGVDGGVHPGVFFITLDHAADDGVGGQCATRRHFDISDLCEDNGTRYSHAA
jgi:hypothetical protein